MPSGAGFHETSQMSRVQFAAFDRSANGATGFIFMPAISKSALSGKRIDIVETGFDRICRNPGLQPSHAGSIDDRATVRPDEELTMRRCVAAAITVGSDGLGQLDGVSKPTVDQG